jgi:hypothetical protein
MFIFCTWPVCDTWRPSSTQMKLYGPSKTTVPLTGQRNGLADQTRSRLDPFFSSIPPPVQVRSLPNPQPPDPPAAAGHHRRFPAPPVPASQVRVDLSLPTPNATWGERTSRRVPPCDSDSSLRICEGSSRWSATRRWSVRRGFPGLGDSPRGAEMWTHLLAM